jgi:hypothetical protein
VLALCFATFALTKTEEVCPYVLISGIIALRELFVLI